MLPRPAISSKRYHEPLDFPENGKASSLSRITNVHRWSKRALARSRLTNIGALGLITFCLILLFGNWQFWLAQRDHGGYGSWSNRPVTLESALPQGTFHNASHLVVVAGHAIWKVHAYFFMVSVSFSDSFQGCHSASWKDEDSWVLQDHQKNNRNVESFYSHILKGFVSYPPLIIGSFTVQGLTLFYSVEIYNSDPSAVLTFSGGVTRLGHPMQSEGQSYLTLSLANGLLKDGDRAFTEDFALDSFQNLLFSIARYHELAVTSGIPSSAAWPSKITVIGFEMKRRRFVELHRQALKFPESQFEYVGVDFADETSRGIGWEGEVRPSILLPFAICQLQLSHNY